MNNYKLCYSYIVRYSDICALLSLSQEGTSQPVDAHSMVRYILDLVLEEALRTAIPSDDESDGRGIHWSEKDDSNGEEDDSDDSNDGDGSSYSGESPEGNGDSDRTETMTSSGSDSGTDRSKGHYSEDDRQDQLSSGIAMEKSMKVVHEGVDDQGHEFIVVKNDDASLE